MALITDRDRTAHLLRRFGFGASETEIDFYAEGGWEKAVDRLLNYTAIEEPFSLPLEAFAVNQNALRPQSLQAWWMAKMLATQRPLQEKMTLFWHDHFATSAQKVTNALLMHEQNETFRTHATGSFKDLLTEASKDPAMIVWLDNQYNVKGKPNENFAREVMELFTLGIGNYTEKDIQEAARAFTGWSFRGADRRQLSRNRTSEFFFNARQFDSGEKAVLGSKGPFTGEDVLNLLCDEPQTARYLTTKIWEWFAYKDPEPGLIDRLAGEFKRSGLHIGTLLRAIMTSKEFYSERAERAVYKTPIDFTVSTLRQLGLGQRILALKAGGDGMVPRNQLGPIAAVLNASKSMGMDIIYPPDVAGWEGGSAWITSATMIERVKWADRLFGTLPTGPGRQVPQVRFPASALFSPSTSPEELATRLISIFDAPIAASKWQALVEAARKASDGRITSQNVNRTAAAVCRLIFGAPEFQFA